MSGSSKGPADRTGGGPPFAGDPFAAWKQLTESMGTVGGPTAIFVTQLEATAETLKERRLQVRALISQLTLFDEQLALFETSLQPVLEWSQARLRLQESVFDPLGPTRQRNDPQSGRS